MIGKPNIIPFKKSSRSLFSNIYKKNNEAMIEFNLIDINKIIKNPHEIKFLER